MMDGRVRTHCRNQPILHPPLPQARRTNGNRPSSAGVRSRYQSPSFCYLHFRTTWSVFVGRAIANATAAASMRLNGGRQTSHSVTG